MDREKSYFGRISRLVHQRFLLFLLAAYAAAAIAPCVGLAVRGVTLGTIVVMGERVAMTLPMLLLATLLVNAGLSAEVAELAGVVKKPHIVLAGVAMNLLVPVGFIALLFQTIRFWHNPEETQNLLVGLAVVAAVPVAGSSTAWSLNANGNMGLSLALVILSTALSPITTPLVLLAVGSMTTGAYAEMLHDVDVTEARCSSRNAWLAHYLIDQPIADRAWPGPQECEVMRGHRTLAAPAVCVHNQHSPARRR
jgi:BASS family bile acid:Na+ symporter